MLALVKCNMASVRKLSSGIYQVQIRRAGMPAVTRSFRKRRDAEAFARAVEGDSELARKLGRASGVYLGEICRLAAGNSVTLAQALSGPVPPAFCIPTG